MFDMTAGITAYAAKAKKEGKKKTGKKKGKEKTKKTGFGFGLY